MKRIALVFWLLLIFAALAAATLKPAEFEQKVFDLTNQQRITHGCQPLQHDTTLVRLARLHSRNMGWNGFFSHVDNTGLRVSGRQKKFCPNYMQSSIGENLYYQERGDRAFSPDKIVEGWMESETHRENILTGDFTHMGCVFLIGNELYVTQVMAKPIMRLLSALPKKFSKERSYILEFEYLSTNPQTDLLCSVSTPDPEARIKVSDMVYYVGSLPTEIVWHDQTHFSLTVNFLAGKGDYGLQVGWGNYYYPDLLTFPVK